MKRLLIHIILICLGIIAFKTNADALDVIVGEDVYCTTDVNLQSSPGEFGGLLGIVKEGTAFKIIKIENDWLYIANTSGKEGWIDRKYVYSLAEKKKVIADLEKKAIGDVNLHQKIEIYKQLLLLDPSNTNYETILSDLGNEVCNSPNFRGAKWGDSIDKVRSIESIELVEEEKDKLVYHTKVIGKDVLVGYYFIENKLIKTRYFLAESHSNKNDYIFDYNDFKKILVKKYGEPLKDETIWRNDLYRNDYSQHGLAVSIGHLVYFTTWDTECTEITAGLSGDNYKISCIVEYNSSDLKDIIEKAKNKHALDAF